MADILSSRIPINAEQVEMLVDLVDEKIGAVIGAAAIAKPGDTLPVVQLAPWYALRTALAKAQEQAA